MLERHFPRQGRVLVLGAGGGREVIALAAKGFQVEGFECSPPLVERANLLLEKRHIAFRVVVIAPNEVPSVHGFDAAVIGWGAYMHIPGRARRIRFLRGVRAALEPGGPSLLSFFARHGTGRSDLWTARLANALRTLRGRGDDPVEVGDRLQGSFDHYFTENEVREEMKASGFRLAYYSEAEYAHAVGIADEWPGPASPSGPAWDDVVCVVSRTVSSPVCDQVAILGPDQQIHRGRTGARVWELVHQPIKVCEIHRTIVEEYDIDEEAARKDVLEVLAQLRDAALIEVRGGGAR